MPYFLCCHGGSRNHCIRTHEGPTRIFLEGQPKSTRSRTPTRIRTSTRCSSLCFATCSTTVLSTRHQLVSDVSSEAVAQLTRAAACLLSYFSTTFGHVISPPVLARPMPPLAPLAPLPSELRPLEPVRPPSPSPPSSESHGTDGHTSLPAAPGGSTPDLALTLPTASASTLASTVSAGYSTAPSSLSLSPSRAPSSDSDVVAPLPRTPVPAADLRRDSTSMGVGMNAGGAGAGGGGGVELFPMESLLALEEHSLNMALFRALGLVLAVKEAMWEELLGRVARGDRQLVRYGWGKNDYSEGASRVLFDGLVEQYRKCVCAGLRCRRVRGMMLIVLVVCLPGTCGRASRCGTRWCSVGGRTRGKTRSRRRS